MSDHVLILAVFGLAALGGMVRMSWGDDPAPVRDVPGLTAANAKTGGETADPAVLAEEVEKVLWAEMNAWYPRCVDTEAGGYTLSYDRQWKPREKQTKRLVVQARMMWTAAEIARLRPARMEEFRAYARHGLKFLREVMWDQEFGGFHWDLLNNGQINPQERDDKHTYGIGFAMYAAATVARNFKDEEALALAQDTFLWLEKHAHDAVNGGYYEGLARNGDPLPPSKLGGTISTDRIGTIVGRKSMNTHIHMLEALTILHQAWPDPRVKTRLKEVYDLVKNHMIIDGAMPLTFTADWKQIPNLTSHGHNVETAFLMLEAAEVLGHEEYQAMLPSAKSLVDHSLAYGYDKELGGVYGLGPTMGKVHETDKNWWSQAEALNAFLLMDELFGKDNPVYYEAFVKTWRFTQKHMIDQEFGGWYGGTDRDGKPPENTDKGNNWKAAYHSGRAMLACADRLQKKAGK